MEWSIYIAHTCVHAEFPKTKFNFKINAFHVTFSPCASREHEFLLKPVLVSPDQYSSR